MEKNIPIEIMPVGNGWLVKRDNISGGPHLSTEIFIFQDLKDTDKSLFSWLEKHFGQDSRNIL